MHGNEFGLSNYKLGDSYSIISKSNVIGIPTLTLMQNYSLLNWTGVFDSTKAI